MARRFSVATAAQLASGEVPRGAAPNAAVAILQRVMATLTVSGSTFTYDMRDATDIELVLSNSGAETLSFTNVGGLRTAQRGIIKVTQAPTTPGTLAYSGPGSVKWPGGSPHVITASINAIDLIEYFSDGTDIYLTLLGANYS